MEFPGSLHPLQANVNPNLLNITNWEYETPQIGDTLPSWQKFPLVVSYVPFPSGPNI